MLYLGNIIKSIREQKQWTQKMLAEDICCVKQLARIENNTCSPNSHILFLLSQKLGAELFSLAAYADDPSAVALKRDLDRAYQAFSHQHYQKTLTIIEQSTYLRNTPSALAQQEISTLMDRCKVNGKNLSKAYLLAQIIA